MNDVEYCNKSQSHNKRGAAIRNIFVNTENEEEAQYIIIASIEKETDLIKCGEFTKKTYYGTRHLTIVCCDRIL